MALIKDKALLLFDATKTAVAGNSSDVCDVLSQCGKVLQELSLAFTDEAWVIDAQMELGELLKRNAPQELAAQMQRAVAELAAHLSDNDSLPTADLADRLRKSVAEAKPGFHYTDDDSVEVILHVLSAFFARGHARCSAEWAPIAKYLGHLSEFTASVAKERYVVQAIVSCQEVQRATHTVHGLSAMLTEANWKSDVAALIRDQQRFKGYVDKSGLESAVEAGESYAK